MKEDYTTEFKYNLRALTESQVPPFNTRHHGQYRCNVSENLISEENWQGTLKLNRVHYGGDNCLASPIIMYYTVLVQNVF